MQILFDQYSKLINPTLFIPSQMQGKIISSLIILCIMLLLRYLSVMAVYRKSKDVKKRYHWRKGTAYFFTFLTIVLVGRLWIHGFQSAATFFGIFAAGLAIALQDMLGNIAGWAFIMWRRPFEVGDRIEVAGHAGDVIDKRLFMFTLMEIGNWVDADQSTGRVIHLPNGLIFKSSLANYSRGFTYIWNEIPILITFESNWEKAKKMLSEIANSHAEHLSSEAEKKVLKAAKRYMIFYAKLTPIVWTSVKDCGVMLTVRYLSDPRKRRSTEQAIWEDVLKEFAKCDDIDFAYPTTRFYDNRHEGKSAAGGMEKIE